MCVGIDSGTLKAEQRREKAGARIAHSVQVRVESTRFSTSDTEVDEYMTANWAGVVVNMLILGFFALAVIGIGLGIYAAKVLKRLEVSSEDKVSTES